MRCFYDWVSFSSTMKLNLFSPSKRYLWSLHWLWRVHDSNAFVAKFWPHFHGILTAYAITWGLSSVVTFTFKFSTLNPRNQIWVEWSLCGKDPYDRYIFRMICHLYLNTQHQYQQRSTRFRKEIQSTTRYLGSSFILKINHLRNDINYGINFRLFLSLASISLNILHSIYHR